MMLISIASGMTAFQDAVRGGDIYADENDS